MNRKLLRVTAFACLLGMTQVMGSDQGLRQEVPPATSADESLTRFDLDFPGGTPEKLVQAIQESGGPAVNVIVPWELRQTELPSFKVQGVTVPELFEAIGHASLRMVPYVSGSTTSFAGVPGSRPVIQERETGYGFRTEALQQGAPLTDQSIWYFYHQMPFIPPSPDTPEPYRVIRYYNISSYLDQYKVEDIITAVQTGWDMLGLVKAAEAASPRLRFHEDTQLLIAVGTEEQLASISDALARLREVSAVVDPATGQVLPARAPPVRRQSAPPAFPIFPAPAHPGKPSLPEPDKE